jgi:hypothetical protein
MFRKHGDSCPEAGGRLSLGMAELFLSDAEAARIEADACRPPK